MINVHKHKNRGETKKCQEEIEQDHKV